ncbi:CIS tube protein [Thalassococcus sp. BH17M4-6]|uniref:CIS tube protein n=1 Tax=Thalassococcus sp. BH17M4-6 TaxID=3413148 RepID=UPI003BC4BCE6
MGKLSFQKLDLEKNPLGDPIEVQFNPTEYSFEKTAKLGEVSLPGLDSPILQFVRGDSEKLSLELFFDGTTPETGGGLLGAIGAGLGAAAGEPQTVVTRVDAFYRMVKISGDLHTPPLVRVTWGDAFPGAVTSESEAPTPTFDAVVETIKRRYTLFDPEGKPLRCIVTLTLREYRTLHEQLTELNLQTSDHTRSHTVREGETLLQIAYGAYKDAARWRVIADANDIADPANLEPGRVLDLPPLVKA